MLDTTVIHAQDSHQGKGEYFFKLLRVMWVEANVQGQPDCICDPIGDPSWGLHYDGLSPLTPVSRNKLLLKLLFIMVLDHGSRSGARAIPAFLILSSLPRSFRL